MVGRDCAIAGAATVAAAPATAPMEAFFRKSRRCIFMSPTDIGERQTGKQFHSIQRKRIGERWKTLISETTAILITKKNWNATVHAQKRQKSLTGNRHAINQNRTGLL
jgi:hypothetical protein